VTGVKMLIEAKQFSTKKEANNPIVEFAGEQVE
jgi:hypothetical protein